MVIESGSSAPDIKKDVEYYQSITLAKSPGILFNSGSLANARFDQYTIKLRVTAYHNGEKVDLTPYVIQLKTSNGLGNSSGRFTILLTFQKRWDAYIHPQDYVEIAFSRHLPDPPVIMRGFVSNVRRTRMIDDSGALHRAITINGENFGKLWNIYQIQYLVSQPGFTNPEGVDTDPVIGLLFPRLLENYGIGSSQDITEIKPADLMRGITDRMMNAQVRALQQLTPQIPLLVSKADVLPEYLLNDLQIQQIEGTAYNLIETYGNRPWCEWFIDDFAEGPIFFYRNTPFKRRNGTYIFEESTPNATYFPQLKISDVDVIQEDIGHTDNETYSYFFTYPLNPFLDQVAFKAWVISDQNLTAEKETSMDKITNPHLMVENLYKYGFKMLQLGSYSILTKDQWVDVSTSVKMTKWLVESFYWAPEMLNGTIQIKGNEHMRIGRYLINTSTNEEYYIESVDHEITMGQAGSTGNNVVSFRTSVGLTRGRKL